jgi:hypothetical protein
MFLLPARFCGGQLRPGRLFARRNLHIHHNAVGAGRHAQRGVLHVRGFLAEDRPQQPLLRRQLGFALGRDFADEDVAGLDFGAHADDTVVAEIL